VSVLHRQRVLRVEREVGDKRIVRQLDLGPRLGFGHIVASETEVPNMLVNLV
jgi:hypothetical protein